MPVIFVCRALALHKRCSRRDSVKIGKDEEEEDIADDITDDITDDIAEMAV